MPPGGAFDPISLGLANVLVGNAPDALGIEFALASAVIVNDGEVTFSVVGAADLRRVTLQTGEKYHLFAQTNGCRTYLCVPGGISMTCGTKLTSGFKLSLELSPALRELRLSDPPISLNSGPIRVTVGPQAHLFDIKDLVKRDYRVSRLASRMGLRLEGSVQSHRHDLPSEPCVPGAVQVTPDGTLIVLGPDGPTLGGYPKPIVVISADLPRVGQLSPGAPISFEIVHLEEALRCYHDQQQRVSKLLSEIRLRGITPAL